jgi:hypothetical protein
MEAGAEAAKRRSDHPVWDVYDLLRTARLNVKYNSALLTRAERWQFGMETVLLVSAPSSAVAGLWFWNTPVGHQVWLYLGAIAAVVAVLKPALGLTKKIKTYEEVVSGYRALDNDLFEISVMVSQKHAYDKQLQTDFNRVLKRRGVLANKEPVRREDKKLKRECTAEVLSELPAASFYVPEDH